MKYQALIYTNAPGCTAVILPAESAFRQACRKWPSVSGGKVWPRGLADEGGLQSGGRDCVSALGLGERNEQHSTSAERGGILPG